MITDRKCYLLWEDKRQAWNVLARKEVELRDRVDSIILQRSLGMSNEQCAELRLVVGIPRIVMDCADGFPAGTETFLCRANISAALRGRDVHEFAAAHQLHMV